ncbi:MAG: molybdopterin-dependent oxidoreductase [Desulfurococcales archaeon]|nr:molybdopterin-dependent oxidoreductase [Desulfurococcales archaeon]
MALEECMLYTSWPSSLTRYPTVLDCAPRARVEPSQALLEAYNYLAILNHVEKKPTIETPELIGGRYLVYKARSGERSKPFLEARSVYDKRTDMTIWAGGVTQALIPGAPRKPPKQPELPEPETIEAPPAPEGQKVIRKPVIYSAEGAFPGHKGKLLVGTYDEHGFKPTSEVPVSRIEGEWVQRDFHCVTGWSVGGIKWRLARLDDILSPRGLKGKWLIAVSTGGYTASIPLEPSLLDNAYIATGLNGISLPVEHGGPIRLVIPVLYGWKSVKWLAGLFVSDLYLDGYWEARGYHWRGLVALDERFKNRSID